MEYGRKSDEDNNELRNEELSKIVVTKRKLMESWEKEITMKEM